jgi:hypothetical protein
MITFKDFARAGCWALTVGFSGLTGYFLFAGADWSASGRGGIAFLCAALFAVLGNIDRIESFKASFTGIEAKIREVNEVIEETKATLRALQEVAAMAGAAVIELSTGAGRYGGGQTIGSKDARREQVLSALDRAGLSAREVASADREWVIADYAQGIFAVFNKGRKFTREQKLYWDKFSLPWRTTTTWPTPDECEVAMNRLRINDRFSRELLNDYRFYMQTGTQRRPEIWADRGNWQKRTGARRTPP